jgi:Protein of unknown function DUF262
MPPHLRQSLERVRCQVPIGDYTPRRIAASKSGESRVRQCKDELSSDRLVGLTIFTAEISSISTPRQSVWSDKYRSDFITTVLMNYPCPSIFLFEQVRPDGTFLYKIVDGKQSVTTLLTSNVATKTP